VEHTCDNTLESVRLVCSCLLTREMTSFSTTFRSISAISRSVNPPLPHVPYSSTSLLGRAASGVLMTIGPGAYTPLLRSMSEAKAKSRMNVATGLSKKSLTECQEEGLRTLFSYLRGVTGSPPSRSIYSHREAVRAQHISTSPGSTLGCHRRRTLRALRPTPLEVTIRPPTEVLSTLGSSLRLWVTDSTR
jgi:hypothetical protein